MALFGKDPVKTLQDSVRAETTNVNRLTADLRRWETTAAERQADARQVARDGGSDLELDKAEGLIRIALDRGQTIRGALSDATEHLAGLQAKLAQDLDTRQRQATAVEVEALAQKLVGEAAALGAMASTIAETATFCSAVVPEASGLVQLTRAVAIEAGTAGELIAKLLRVHGQAVARGEGSSTLRRPDTAPYQPPAEVVPASTTLFAMRPVRYTNVSGNLTVIQKFQDCPLMPPATARRAIASKACTQLDDPLRRKHHGTVEGHGRADLALDLDAEPHQRAADPIMASTFTPLDRGPAHILQIKAGGK